MVISKHQKGGCSILPGFGLELKRKGKKTGDVSFPKPI
jgi:hypothetical protein